MTEANSPRRRSPVSSSTIWLPNVACALAALIKFAVLPGLETFVAFAFVFGLVLVPAGALMAEPSYTAIFTPVAAYFCVFLAPTNLMSYDTQQFYNATLATLALTG